MGAGEGVFVWEVVREGEERGDKWCRIGVIVVRVEQDMAREGEEDNKHVERAEGKGDREVKKKNIEHEP